MPYISTKVSVSISPEKEQSLKTKFGKAISILPGKSEHWLMLSFEDNCRLYFQGDNSQPTAFVEVKIYGKANADAYNRLTEEISSILGEELSIPPARIYVKYEETPYWGFNGSNF